LWIGFGALLLLMLFLMLVGLRQIEVTRQQLDTIVDNHMRKIELATRMRTLARERTVSLQKMILLSDPFERDEQWVQFNNFGGEFARLRGMLLEMELTQEEQEVLKGQGALTGKAVPLQMRVAELALDGRTTAAHKLLTEKAIPAQDEVFEQLDKLYRLQLQMAAAAETTAHDTGRAARLWMILLSGGTMVTGLIVSFVVMRRAQKADIALQYEKERAQVTLHSIGDAVIRTNVTGGIEYMNPVAERLAGWTLKEAAGRNLEEILRLVSDNAPEAMENPVAGVLAGGEVITGSADVVPAAKRRDMYPVELTAAPIHDHAGRVAGAVLVFRDVTELRALGRELSYQATHDALTGFLNRREFDRLLQQALESARMHNMEHALCYLDLDMFKVVNDSCGHLAGDELLRQLAARLHGQVRTGDIVARVGGDEFAILLEGCTLDKAAEIAENVRRIIRNFHFVWEDKSFEIGVSIGVVRVGADSGNLWDVFRAADVACQVAKDEGRNRIHVYRADDATVTVRRGEITWVERINRALAHDGFVLYGQWIRPLNDAGARPAQCEILIRMLDDNGGVVSPAAFLPSAERYHLMPAIDRWVIRTALALLGGRAWPAEGPVGSFNINLSGQSLYDPEFPLFVARQLEASGIPPRLICFEITETAAVTNMSSAMYLISTLRGMGCRFALDDFGSGLSSFTYLKSMPVDYLKIAGPFVRGMLEDSTSRAMVHSINQLAHVMHIKTVAEYVESDAIRRALKELDVDYGQGYALAHPEPLLNILSGLPTPEPHVEHDVSARRQA
jgi:diguanylate cyclase (GGDEF)-like protein/PAS domain S-box-containing protein